MRLFDKFVMARIVEDVSCLTVIAIDEITKQALNEFDPTQAIEFSKYPFCRPPFAAVFCDSDLPSNSWLPATVRQFASITGELDGDAAPAKCLISGERFFATRFLSNFSESVVVNSVDCVWSIHGDGSLADVGIAKRNSIDDEQKKAIATICRIYFEATLLTFTFLNCSNVKLEDVTDELQPSPKIRRRLKIPEVKCYTLNIAGHVARPSRNYNEGPQGVMPFHLCRGHFATYTAERPMFGNPKLVGRYWHPPHMKGKKECGEIIKDYAIQG